MRINTAGFLVLAGWLAVSNPANARLGWYPDFDELAKTSTVIVIAEDVSVRDLSETSVLPNYFPETKVIGVETTFKVVTVLKGTMPRSTFVLHHYRFPTPSAVKDSFAINGTSMLTFLGNKRRFLMFLREEPGGRYAPASGQTDPYLSVRPLSADTSWAYLVPIVRCLFFWTFLVIVLPVVLLVCGLIYLKKRRKLNNRIEPTGENARGSS